MSMIKGIDEIAKIREKLSTGELLAGLAEEAAELVQAALKTRRAVDGKNPTPVSLEDSMAHMAEEVADVFLYADALNVDWVKVLGTVGAKRRRWLKRLWEGEEECTAEKQN